MLCYVWHDDIPFDAIAGFTSRVRSRNVFRFIFTFALATFLCDEMIYWEKCACNKKWSLLERVYDSLPRGIFAGNDWRCTEEVSGSFRGRPLPRLTTTTLGPELSSDLTTSLFVIAMSLAWIDGSAWDAKCDEIKLNSYFLKRRVSPWSAFISLTFANACVLFRIGHVNYTHVVISLLNWQRGTHNVILKLIFFWLAFYK